MKHVILFFYIVMSSRADTISLFPTWKSSCFKFLDSNDTHTYKYIHLCRRTHRYENTLFFFLSAMMEITKYGKKGILIDNGLFEHWSPLVFQWQTSQVALGMTINSLVLIIPSVEAKAVEIESEKAAAQKRKSSANAEVCQCHLVDNIVKSSQYNGWRQNIYFFTFLIHLF